MIPARPPIRLEDGLVEVGWEGDLEAEPTRPESPAIEGETAGAPFETDPNEELVEDRYAALQAWAEWSRNRERSPLRRSSRRPTPTRTRPSRVPIPDHTRPSGRGRMRAPSPSPSVRAETPHDFAPYSQLFTRLRHSL